MKRTTYIVCITINREASIVDTRTHDHMFYNKEMNSQNTRLQQKKRDRKINSNGGRRWRVLTQHTTQWDEKQAKITITYTLVTDMSWVVEQKKRAEKQKGAPAQRA